MKIIFPLKLMLVNADGEAITVIDEITDFNIKEESITVAYNEELRLFKEDTMRDIMITLDQCNKKGS